MESEEIRNARDAIIIGLFHFKKIRKADIARIMNVSRQLVDTVIQKNYNINIK